MNLMVSLKTKMSWHHPLVFLLGFLQAAFFIQCILKDNVKPSHYVVKQLNDKGLSSNHLHLCWWVWAIFPCLYVSCCTTPCWYLVVFHSDDGSLLKHVRFLPRIKKKKLSSLWVRVVCKKSVDRKNTVVSKAGLKADQCGHPHRLRQAQNKSAESVFFVKT